MPLETNFCFGTIEAILNTIPSGWQKVLALLPNECGEVVTNPNNKVQYAHNHKFELFLYMQQGFAHTSFGVGTIQTLLIKNDGRYRKPDASVTGSTHANHRGARSPRPTPERPARDNPIAEL